MRDEQTEWDEEEEDESGENKVRNFELTDSWSFSDSKMQNNFCENESSCVCLSQLWNDSYDTMKRRWHEKMQFTPADFIHIAWYKKLIFSSPPFLFSSNRLGFMMTGGVEDLQKTE